MVILMALLGAVLGSFYACMGYRIPNKISLIYPRSHCENCKKELKWYMNIPIFSYIFLKGKCAYCHKKINPLSFIVEVLTSVLFVCFYLRYAFSLHGIFAYILISVLSVTLISDINYYYISDRVIVISYILSLISIIFQNKEELVYLLIGSVCSFVFFFLTKLIGDKVFKRESLGWGDVKLILLIGLCLGIFPTFVSIFLGSLLGLIFSIFDSSKREIPFGPFLLIGSLIVLYFYSNISLFC